MTARRLPALDSGLALCAALAHGILANATPADVGSACIRRPGYFLFLERCCHMNEAGPTQWLRDPITLLSPADLLATAGHECTRPRSATPGPAEAGRQPAEGTSVPDVVPTSTIKAIARRLAHRLQLPAVSLLCCQARLAPPGSSRPPWVTLTVACTRGGHVAPVKAGESPGLGNRTPPPVSTSFPCL